MNVRFFTACFVLVALAISCKENRQSNNERKPVTEELSGEVLHFDGIQVPSPVLLSSYDDLLLVKTADNNAKIALCRVDGDSVKVVDRGIKKGRGPYEFIYANYCVSGDSLFVIDSNPMGFTALYGIPLKVAGALSDYSCWRRYPCDGFPKMITAGYFARIGQRRFVVNAGEPGTQQIFTVLDFNDMSATPLDFWPDDGNECGTEVKQMAYMNNRVFGLADGRFVYGTRPGRYLSVVKADGTTIKVLSKIYDIFPQFVEKNHNIRYLPDQHKGVNIRVSDRRLYVAAFPDRKDGDDNYKGFPLSFFDEIEIYDWDGRFIKCIRTDRPYSTFCPSSDDKYLYTTTLNLETGDDVMVRYELE